MARQTVTAPAGSGPGAQTEETGVRSRSKHAETESCQRESQLFQGMRAWLRPNGLFCVVLGPDGVGKSTTIQQLQSELEAFLGPCTKRRWRPGIIKSVTPDTGNRVPHAKAVRGSVMSTLFILTLVLDFTIGYALSTYPAMARSEAVIFDRYFHDLLIDPKRYRYAGPKWLPQLLSKFIPPRKALFIILDAEEEVILSRKQELPIHELKRQRAAYRTFASRTPGAMIISADRPVDEIVSEIVHRIAEVLAARSPSIKRSKNWI